MSCCRSPRRRARFRCPPSGAPILLLADRQRSAGYDKPAVIHPDDLALVGQLRPGERLRFAFVGDHPVPWFRDL